MNILNIFLKQINFRLLKPVPSRLIKELVFPSLWDNLFLLPVGL